MEHLSNEHGQNSYILKFRYVFTDDILAQTNLALKAIPMVKITETNALIYATVKTQKSVRKTGSRPRTHHSAWQQQLKRKIKLLRSDVSKLSQIAKKNCG